MDPNPPLNSNGCPKLCATICDDAPKPDVPCPVALCTQPPAGCRFDMNPPLDANGCPEQCVTICDEPKEPQTCEACVSSGRSWQVGTCNPGSECLVADTSCYTTMDLCKTYHENEKAATECPKQQNCLDCANASPKCGKVALPAFLVLTSERI